MCPDTEDSDDAEVCDIRARPDRGQVRRHDGDPDQDRAGAHRSGGGAGRGHGGLSRSGRGPRSGSSLGGASFIRTLCSHVTEVPLQPADTRESGLAPVIGAVRAERAAATAGSRTQGVCAASPDGLPQTGPLPSPRGAVAPGCLPTCDPRGRASRPGSHRTVLGCPFLKWTQGQGQGTPRGRATSLGRHIPRRKGSKEQRPNAQVTPAAPWRRGPQNGIGISCLRSFVDESGKGKICISVCPSVCLRISRCFWITLQTVLPS